MRRIDYDYENDILYISFSDQSNLYGDDISENITIRKDWDTDEITGITIFDVIGESSMEWISVEDRLPDIDQDCIVSGKMKYFYEKEWEYFVDVACRVPSPYKGADWIWSTWDDWDEGQEIHITHWMPMPKPVKTDE